MFVRRGSGAQREVTRQHSCNSDPSGKPKSPGVGSSWLSPSPGDPLFQFLEYEHPPSSAPALKFLNLQIFLFVFFLKIPPYFNHEKPVPAPILLKT